jgi:Domain of unknown function (DUF4145)
MSWWDLGESTGYSGNDLALYRITCGFCGEGGNFEQVHHLEKKHGSKRKTLNYEILKCGNCGNYSMVLWSASSMFSHQGMHDFAVIPRPRQTTKFPEHWPEDVGRHWLQARRSIEGKNWDAASLMARSAIQLVARYHKATGRNLKEEIDDLAQKGVLSPIMKDWSHEVRELGNEYAHPAPGAEGTHENDARDVVDFLGVLLTMLYDLPHQIEQYRARKDT